MIVSSLLLLLLLVVFQGTPVRSKCKETIVSGIKDYWKANGVPTNILKTTSKVNQFRFMYATPQAVGEGVKCVLASHDQSKGLAPATFYYEDGSSVTTVFKAYEKDGVIYQSLQCKTYKEYVLLNKHGVLAMYKCTVGSKTESSVVIIAVDIAAEDDPNTQATLKEAYAKFIEFGIKDLQEIPACPDIANGLSTCGSS